MGGVVTSGGNTGSGATTATSSGGNSQSGGGTSTGGKGGSTLPGTDGNAGGADTQTPTPDAVSSSGVSVGLYKVFERSIENTKSYKNRFTDVDLKCTYTSPTGRKTDFIGFFDGDGKGGGDMGSGTVWKIRFMPDALGVWTYEWSWSDGTQGGKGDFVAVAAGAGKGVLRAYKENPHWLAYNGTTPVFLKSYYESSMRPFAQPLPCVKGIYQTLLDNGYNHFQVNWLLPILSGENLDCGSPSTTKPIYTGAGKASTTMQLDVWHLLEPLMDWLNDKNVGLFMFLGFDGGRNNQPQAFASLSAAEQDFFVKYVVARLGAYAIIASWNYVWEVPGNTENGELGCMRLVKKYDVFDHLRTYQDEKPVKNYFDLPEYNFAGVENHSLEQESIRDVQNWGEPWTHHVASLISYVPGKPVYMVEGNLLWRRYWAAALASKANFTQTPDLTRIGAWAVATAAASFTWCGHLSLSLKGSNGLPFSDSQGNPYRAAAKGIDILTRVMNEEVAFYRMTPQDALLSATDSKNVWCLAELGNQYLVFATAGKSFSLTLATGTYSRNAWLDTKTGTTTPVDAIEVQSERSVAFTPPSRSTDWVLLVRKP